MFSSLATAVSFRAERPARRACAAAILFRATSQCIASGTWTAPRFSYHLLAADGPVSENAAQDVERSPRRVIARASRVRERRACRDEPTDRTELGAKNFPDDGE